MAAISYTIEKLRALLTTCENGSQLEYKGQLEKLGIPIEYGTNVGRLLVAVELLGMDDKAGLVDLDWDSTCKKEHDKRCQVGHVESNLKSRVKDANSSKKRLELKKAYDGFMNNVEATVLIIDKSNLNIPEPNSNGKITIDSIESRFSLDLSKYDAPAGTPLCDSSFYANERVPDTDIYGTGYMVTPSKVVTAAHVLLEADKYGVDISNLMFIRGRFVYDTTTTSIEVEENQLYVLDEKEIYISSQMRKGTERGDIAWVHVKPYGKNAAFDPQRNGYETSPYQPNGPVYALGHGLGLPMKLSFKGSMSQVAYNQSGSMFACKLNILPGSSGSPIFDANSHKLIGIVSGLHEIHTKIVLTKDCGILEIDMKSDLSGVATYITPFIHL